MTKLPGRGRALPCRPRWVRLITRRRHTTPTAVHSSGKSVWPQAVGLWHRSSRNHLLDDVRQLCWSAPCFFCTFTSESVFAMLITEPLIHIGSVIMATLTCFTCFNCYHNCYHNLKNKSIALSWTIKHVHTSRAPHHKNNTHSYFPSLTIWLISFYTNAHKEMKKEAENEGDWVILHWQVCYTDWPLWKASITLATGRQLNSARRL